MCCVCVAIGCFILTSTSSLVIPEKFYESLIDTVSEVIKVSCVHVCTCVCICVFVCIRLWSIPGYVCLSIGPCEWLSACLSVCSYCV